MFQIKTLETRRKIGFCALASATMLAMVNAVSADNAACPWRKAPDAASECKPSKVSFLNASGAPYIRAGALIGATVSDEDGTPLGEITDFVFDRNNRLQDVVVTTISADADMPAHSLNNLYTIEVSDIHVVVSPMTPGDSPMTLNPETSNSKTSHTNTSNLNYFADEEAFTPFRYEWSIQSTPTQIDAIAVEEVTFTSLTSAYVMNRDGAVLASAEDVFVDPTGHIGYIMLDALQTGTRVAVKYQPLPATDTNDIILDIDSTDLKKARDFDPHDALPDAV